MMGSLDIRQEKKIKNKRGLKGKHSRIKYLLILALLLTAMGLLAFSPLFNIKYIEVKGNRHYKEEDIIDASGIITGTNGFRMIGSSIRNIYLFRCGQAERAILKNHSYIKNISANYIIPNRIIITVAERSPIGILPYPGADLLVDAEGYVLDTVRDTEKAGLPFIKGLKFERYEVGQKVTVDNQENFKCAIEVLNAVCLLDRNDEPVFYKSVSYIDVSDLNQVYLFIDSRILVNIGGLQDLNYKIRFLKEICLKKIKKEERGYLDFTSGENPDFILEK